MDNKVRINFEFPAEEYPFLKMMCAQRRMSLRQLATDLLLKEMEDYEDGYWAEEADKIWEAIDRGDMEMVEWEEAKHRFMNV